MFKKIILLFFILIPLCLIAQDLPFSVKNSTKYSISGMVGYIKVDSVKYSQLRLIQEFKIKKVGVGVDLDFLFDKNYHLRKSGWDQIKDYVDKIYYVSYADIDNAVYLHLGGFPYKTIGNGLIMLNYSNMLLYPDLWNPGLMVGVNPDWIVHPNFEIFTSNLYKNQIMAFNASSQLMPDDAFPVVDKMVWGFTYVIDRNQYGNLKYVVPDSVSSEINSGTKRPAAIYGFNYTLPILSKDNATFGHYAEFAHIADYGTGYILPGFYSDFKFIKVNLEYRIYKKEFAPAFFDHSYERTRAFMIGDELVTKEQTLTNYNNSYGWYGKVQAIIGKRAKAMVAWQDMYGKDLKTGKSIWIRFWVDTQYKRLENFSFAYSKTNVEHMAITKISVPSADISGSMTFRISEKRWFVIGKYSENYNDQNNDGTINWLKETDRSLGLGVKYLF